MILVVISDRWEMAGAWLDDEWENTCCIRTPNTDNKHQYNTKPYSTNKRQNQMAGWLALDVSNKSGENLNHREMAG